MLGVQLFSSLSLFFLIFCSRYLRVFLVLSTGISPVYCVSSHRIYIRSLTGGISLPRTYH